MNAVYGGLSLIDPAAARSVLVVFSDGLDTSSWIGEGELVEMARAANAVVYAVDNSNLGPRPSRVRASTAQITTQGERARGRAGRGFGALAFDTYSAREGILERVAETTGGRVFRVEAGSELEAHFRGVLDEIRTRYLLTYYPRDVPEPGWHRLEVKLKRKKGELRTRDGYFVASGPIR